MAAILVMWPGPFEQNFVPHPREAPYEILSLYSERTLNPPVVYTTDRFKAVVPMLFLFCVAL